MTEVPPNSTIRIEDILGIFSDRENRDLVIKPIENREGNVTLTRTTQEKEQFRNRFNDTIHDKKVSPTDQSELEKLFPLGIDIQTLQDAANTDSSLVTVDNEKWLNGLVDGVAPHEILGILPGASPEEARKRYKFLIQQNHPSKAMGLLKQRSLDEIHKTLAGLHESHGITLTRSDPHLTISEESFDTLFKELESVMNERTLKILLAYENFMAGLGMSQQEIAAYETEWDSHPDYSGLTKELSASVFGRPNRKDKCNYYSEPHIEYVPLKQNSIQRIDNGPAFLCFGNAESRSLLGHPSGYDEGLKNIHLKSLFAYIERQSKKTISPILLQDMAAAYELSSEDFLMFLEQFTKEGIHKETLEYLNQKYNKSLFPVNKMSFDECTQQMLNFSLLSHLTPEMYQQEALNENVDMGIILRSDGGMSIIFSNFSRVNFSAREVEVMRQIAYGPTLDAPDMASLLGWETEAPA